MAGRQSAAPTTRPQDNQGSDLDGRVDVGGATMSRALWLSSPALLRAVVLMRRVIVPIPAEAEGILGPVPEELPRPDRAVARQDGP
jgi:hypothetical protein